MSAEFAAGSGWYGPHLRVTRRHEAAHPPIVALNGPAGRDPEPTSPGPAVATPGRPGAEPVLKEK